MKAFIALTLEEQAAIVLIALLEDVATRVRTMASVEHHINDLYNLLSDKYDVPDQEVASVVAAVAKSGVEMLPAYEVDAEGSGGLE